MPFAVFEESARVDLDAWNSRLERAHVPITLLGRGPDGEIVDVADAEITRRDLWQQARFSGAVADSPFAWADHTTSTGCELGCDPGHLLSTVLLTSAWAHAQPYRRVTPIVVAPLARDAAGQVVYVDPQLRELLRFPAAPGKAYARLTAAGMPWQLATHVVSVFSTRTGARRVVPMEPAALRVLQHLQVLPATRRSVPSPGEYLRYQEVLRRWAVEAGVAPELIEQWLLRCWRRFATAAVAGTLAPGLDDGENLR